jgi:hypothetical protein
MFHFLSVLCAIQLTLSLQLSAGQDTSTTGGEIDESLVNRWDDTINFEGCFKDLVKADRNGDNVIKEDEYLSFIQEYGKRICFTTDNLNVQQKGVFNSLSCLCRTNTIASLSTQEQGIANGQCCIGNNAQITLTSASKDKGQRSPAEQDYLTTVCKLTDATIDGKCRPVIDERDTPLVPILPSDAAPPPPNRLDWWEWLLIALAALLLFCLACCCVWKKRKGNPEEDEENQVTTKQLDGVEKHPSLSSPKGLNNTEPMYPEKPIDQSILKPVKVPNEPKETFVVNSNPNVFPVQLRPVGPPIIGTLAKEVAEKALAAASVAGSRSSNDSIMGDGPLSNGNNARARGKTEGDSESEYDDEVRKKFGGQRLPNDPDEEILRIIGSPQLLPIDPPPPKPIVLNPIPPKESDNDEWDHPGRNLEYPTRKDDDSAQVFDPYVPDGGVVTDNRPQKQSLDWRREWHRQYPDEPEVYDNRKHRIQSGLGEGELWNKLDNDDDTTAVKQSNGNDAFDWVIQSALGALHENTTSTTVQQQSSSLK